MKSFLFLEIHYFCAWFLHNFFNKSTLFLPLISSAKILFWCFRLFNIKLWTLTYNFLVWLCANECVPDPRRIKDNPTLIAVALISMALPPTPIADITQYGFVFL